MKRYFENLAKALLGQNYNALAENEQKVINSIAEHTTVSENVNDAYSDSLTTGQKIADVVARFGGSWWFISLFFMFIIAWILTNSYLLIDQPFDPYPYILLNLGLSSLAAFQAPIIMMSQNRQAAKDRIKQDATFEINLKLELQVMRLHTKLDLLSERLTPPTASTAED